jgi:glycosyltransferase involved in cell wall biosynthesis
MKRIGIDARLTHYRTGGISTYIRRLITALEVMTHGHDFSVLHSRKTQETLSTRFHRAVVWTPAHHRLERLALSVELARFRFDLLHSPDFIPPLRGAKRHIITVHDLTFLHYPQHLTAEARRYYNAQIDAAVRHADHILSDSEASKRDMIAMLGVPAEKITVHMLGVDESFRPQEDALLQECRKMVGLPAQFILFVGTFEPRKNIAGLLRAYRLLLERLPDAPTLVLAGTRGWLFDETMREIQRLELGGRVHWSENIPQKYMPALYTLARVLIVPSFYEGFGLPALEAMACGTPTIVSNRSSLPEVVGDVGLQVNPDDDADIASALATAITSDDWHRAESAKATARSALFRWEDTARIALSVYNKVLA